MSESKTPICDKSKVDAGWIMASHSSGEFVPLKDALKLELELNEARAEVNNLLPQVQAYRDAEIKNPLARSESIALKWMNRALSAESQLTTAQQEIAELKRVIVEALDCCNGSHDRTPTVYNVEEILDSAMKGTK